VHEANETVFDNGLENEALNMDVLEIDHTDFDLVYVDPPYISPKGRVTDYHHLYHFLEGLCNYEKWGGLIDHRSKHLRLKRRPNLWGKKRTAEDAFRHLFEKFQDSILVVSYRSPGFPSESTIRNLLGSYKRRVEVHRERCDYALSRTDDNYELLFIGV